MRVLQIIAQWFGFRIVPQYTIDEAFARIMVLPTSKDREFAERDLWPHVKTIIVWK